MDPRVQQRVVRPDYSCEARRHSPYRLTNNLANELYDTSSLHNNFKDFDTTNVHTHGLHIHGETPGDNIFTSVHAGSTYEYTYEIPANHMGGIHWYHPHHHGSASI